LNLEIIDRALKKFETKGVGDMGEQHSKFRDEYWEEMIKLEPRLKALYDYVCQINDDEREPSFCGNEIWYAVGRGKLSSLVGNGATVQALRHSTAYEVAFEKIYDALPPCRECKTCF